MNKNYIKRSIVPCIMASTMIYTLSSCTEGFQEENRPGECLSSEELNRDNYTASSFIVQMENESFPEQENTYQMNQDLIGNTLGRFFTYANNSFAEKNFAKFNAPDGWVSYPYKYSQPKTVSAFKAIARLTNKQGVMYALALIMRAANFLRLTDMYGPLQIGAVKDNPNAYSSQEDVYKSLIKDLDEATSIIKPLLLINPNLTVAEEYDKVYKGNCAKWEKYANSLKLRMAIRMRFVAPELAKQIGEKAVKDGVITKNEDNCTIEYSPNGLYKTSVEWGDTRAAADIESYMTGYKDPRLMKYFNATATQGARPVIGCRVGAKIGNKAVAVKLYSSANVTKDTRGVWLSASEMAFCRAEGALANWANMGGSVEQLYNEAIRLSFEQWGAKGADDYINNDTNKQADYVDAAGGYGANANAVSTITIKWNDSATEEEKMERLITQKWIALYPDGQEGWCELRRTGYPKVFPVAQSTGSTLQVPNRIPFAHDEITQNKNNYDKAVKMLRGGQDNYEAKMWWQK